MRGSRYWWEGERKLKPQTGQKDKDKMTDHRAKGQRVLGMVHLITAIKADFGLVYFWFLGTFHTR